MQFLQRLFSVKENQLSREIVNIHFRFLLDAHLEKNSPDYRE